ncbi:MAG: F0F1 ATP synthase subunit B family protein [Vulcanimicrobiaceae bacterium]
MFLQPDGTFWIQLVSFVVFYALLNVLFLRPVSRAIRERRAYINGVTSDYDTYQAEANALRAQSEEVRARARRDAEQTIAQARAEASNATAELATQYGQQVQRTVEDAARTVQAEAHSARADEARVVQQLADLMLERTLSESSR